MESALIPQDELNEIIPEDNILDEVHLFSTKVRKISSWGYKHDRILMLSTHQIYQLTMEFEVRKQVPIADLRYVIKCAKSDEILLYFNGHFTYRLLVPQYEEFLELVKIQFPQYCPTTSLKVFVIDD